MTLECCRKYHVATVANFHVLGPGTENALEPMSVLVLGAS